MTFNGQNIELLDKIFCVSYVISLFTAKKKKKEIQGGHPLNMLIP